MPPLHILLMLGLLWGGNDSTAVRGQKQESGESLFVVLYAPGPAWDTGKAPAEQLHFRSHAKRLGTLRKEGQITIGARYADKGMLVLQAGSLEAAQEIVHADSAVIAGTFTAEVHLMSVFYAGCVGDN